MKTLLVLLMVLSIGANAAYNDAIGDTIRLRNDKLFFSLVYSKTDKFTKSTTYREINKNTIHLGEKFDITFGPSITVNSTDTFACFTFFSSSPNWKFLDYHPLKMLCDSSLFDFDVDYRGDVGSGYVTEGLFAPVSIKDLIRLGTCKDLSIKIGIYEIHVKSDREAWRLLGTRFTPASVMR